MVDLIAVRSTEVDTGAGNIDHILRRTLLPQLSSAILEQMAERGVPEQVTVDVDAESNFVTRFAAEG